MNFLLVIIAPYSYFFYFDDVNLNNPLTKKIHKLSFFYHQLANINAKYRSKLKSNHLLAICKTSLLKKYGINAIFAPIVDDLKILGKGYKFQVFGGVMRIRGALLALLADTPASQLSGALRKCRLCIATFESMQVCITEEEFTLRTKEEHTSHLELLENAPSTFSKEYYSRKCGVCTKSKLLEAPYFDVTQQLPMDIIHVLVEGVLAYEIKYLLRYYISEGCFSLTEINNDIRKFPLGYAHCKDRSFTITEGDLTRESSTNLGQTASRFCQSTLTTIATTGYA